jgi:hypothetical protein
MAEADIHTMHAGRVKTAQDVLHDRPLANWHERLRDDRGVWAKAHAAAARQQDRPHITSWLTASPWLMIVGTIARAD